LRILCRKICQIFKLLSVIEILCYCLFFCLFSRPIHFLYIFFLIYSLNSIDHDCLTFCPIDFPISFNFQVWQETFFPNKYFLTLQLCFITSKFELIEYFRLSLTQYMYLYVSNKFTNLNLLVAIVIILNLNFSFELEILYNEFTV